MDRQRKLMSHSGECRLKASCYCNRRGRDYADAQPRTPDAYTVRGDIATDRVVASFGKLMTGRRWIVNCAVRQFSEFVNPARNAIHQKYNIEFSIKLWTARNRPFFNCKCSFCIATESETTQFIRNSYGSVPKKEMLGYALLKTGEGAAGWGVDSPVCPKTRGISSPYPEEHLRQTIDLKATALWHVMCLTKLKDLPHMKLWILGVKAYLLVFGVVLLIPACI